MPADRLEEVLKFCKEGLVLKVLGALEDHADYNGVNPGLTGVQYHLEFTSLKNGRPCAVPFLDNLLVLYIPNITAINAIEMRQKSMGYGTVLPENPYWKSKRFTIEDPDGWRVVLMHTTGIYT